MQTIDLESIIKYKTNRKIPKFIARLVKKIICLDRINEIIVKYGKDNQGIAFAEKVLEDLNITTSIKGLENIPRNEKLIFVSNHPLGALEALAIGKYLDTLFKGQINFITNEILTYIPPLKEIFTPVEVGSNKQDREKLNNIEQLFVSDKQIIIFPSGVVSRRIDGKVQDFEWKKMFVAKARQYQRNIVPIYCSGQCSEFFLKFSNFRKKLGIKTSIELILFPREMFKYEGKSIDITIGQPISYQSLTTDISDKKHAEDIRKLVYELA
jgi:hemolysin